MTPEERRRVRNETLDEVIQLVRGYNEHAHKILHIRGSLRGRGIPLPRTLQGLLLSVLPALKDPEPVYVAATVVAVERGSE